MGSRLELQALLENILGSRNVYFQPPNDLRMEYDAIRYSISDRNNTFANNNVYKQDTAYDITVIYEDPDSDLPVKISKLPKCRFSRHYVADNLNHDVFTLYY